MSYPSQQRYSMPAPGGFHPNSAGQPYREQVPPRQPYPNANGGGPSQGYQQHQRGLSYPSAAATAQYPQQQQGPYPPTAYQNSALPTQEPQSPQRRRPPLVPTAASAPAASAPLGATTYLTSTTTAAPLMTQFFSESPLSTGLSTSATAFALRAYLEVFLYYIGYDPSTGTSPQTFISLNEHKLGRELGLPPDKARKLYLEIWDATTPVMETVCHAIIGMDEKLGCSEEVCRAVRFLFRRNHGITPEEMLGGSGKVVGVYGESVLEEKVFPGLIRNRKGLGLTPSGESKEGNGGWKKLFGKKGWKFGGKNNKAEVEVEDGGAAGSGSPPEPEFAQNGAVRPDGEGILDKVVALMAAEEIEHAEGTTAADHELTPPRQTQQLQEQYLPNNNGAAGGKAELRLENLKRHEQEVQEYIRNHGHPPRRRMPPMSYQDYLMGAKDELLDAVDKPNQPLAMPLHQPPPSSTQKPPRASVALHDMDAQGLGEPSTAGAAEITKHSHKAHHYRRPSDAEDPLKEKVRTSGSRRHKEKRRPRVNSVDQGGSGGGSGEGGSGGHGRRHSVATAGAAGAEMALAAAEAINGHHHRHQHHQEHDAQLEEGTTGPSEAVSKVSRRKKHNREREREGHWEREREQARRERRERDERRRQRGRREKESREQEKRQEDDEEGQETEVEHWTKTDENGAKKNANFGEGIEHPPSPLEKPPTVKESSRPQSARSRLSQHPSVPPPPEESSEHQEDKPQLEGEGGGESQADGGGGGEGNQEEKSEQHGDGHVEGNVEGNAEANVETQASGEGERKAEGQGEGQGEGQQGEGENVEGQQGDVQQGVEHQGEGHNGEGHQGEGQGEIKAEGPPGEAHNGEGEGQQGEEQAGETQQGESQGDGNHGEGHQGEGQVEGQPEGQGNEQPEGHQGEAQGKGQAEAAVEVSVDTAEGGENASPENGTMQQKNGSTSHLSPEAVAAAAASAGSRAGSRPGSTRTSRSFGSQPPPPALPVADEPPSVVGGADTDDVAVGSAADYTAASAVTESVRKERKKRDKVKDRDGERDRERDRDRERRRRERDREREREDHAQSTVSASAELPPSASKKHKHKRHESSDRREHRENRDEPREREHHHHHSSGSHRHRESRIPSGRQPPVAAGGTPEDPFVTPGYQGYEIPPPAPPLFREDSGGTGGLTVESTPTKPRRRKEKDRERDRDGERDRERERERDRHRDKGERSDDGGAREKDRERRKKKEKERERERGERSEKERERGERSEREKDRERERRERHAEEDPAAAEARRRRRKEREREKAERERERERIEREREWYERERREVEAQGGIIV